MYHLQKSVQNSGVTLSGFKKHYGASKLPEENLIILPNVPLSQREFKKLYYLRPIRIRNRLF